MSLKKELENISGVKEVNEIEGEILQVVWFGHPSDYKNRLRELRDEYEHEIIETPKDKREETGDGMPVNYISVKS